VHVERYRVRVFQCDERRRLGVGGLFGLLQDAAGVHAAALGAGMDLLLERGLAWMLHRVAFEVEAWPEEGAELELHTWPTGFPRAFATRDFELRQGARALARASSAWVVVSLAERKAIRVPDWLRELVPSEGGALVPIDSRRVAKLEQAELERRFLVRRADLDRVGHVNNARYAEWVAESVPDACWSARELVAMDIMFRAEALYGDAVRSEAASDEDGFAHRLVREGDGAVLVDARTRWR